MASAITTPNTCLKTFGITILAFSGAVLAAPPEDNQYAGGPESDPAIASISETWHLFDLDSNPTPLVDSHPFNGHGATDEEKLSLAGHKITLHNRGQQWFLVPGSSLNWTPPSILLTSHPLFNPWGAADQWRWINVAPVTIDNHQHDICIGYLDLNNPGRRDDDQLMIAIVDRSNPPTTPDCGDPTNTHPGHSGADR